MAGLLLTRSSGRRKEIAIRLSVGATRWQIVRQLLLESLLMGAVGGIAGLAMARLGVLLVTRLSIPGKQVLALVVLDDRMLLYGLGLAMASGLVFGLVPAVQLLRDSQTAAMARSRRRWFQDVFIVAEVGGAFVLLVMTGLLLRSLWTVQQIPTRVRRTQRDDRLFHQTSQRPGLRCGYRRRWRALPAWNPQRWRILCRSRRAD